MPCSRYQGHHAAAQLDAEGAVNRWHSAYPVPAALDALFAAWLSSAVWMMPGCMATQRTAALDLYCRGLSAWGLLLAGPDRGIDGTGADPWPAGSTSACQALLEPESAACPRGL